MNELTAVIKNSVAECLQDVQNYKEPRITDRKIMGIRGLAKFLQCSEPTAGKIGKSGKFPRYQTGHTIFFYESEVLKGLHS